MRFGHADEDGGIVVFGDGGSFDPGHWAGSSPYISAHITIIGATTTIVT